MHCLPPKFYEQSPLVASPEPSLELLSRLLAPRWPSGVPFISRLRTPGGDGGRAFLIGQAHAVMMLAMVISKQLLDGGCSRPAEKLASSLGRDDFTLSTRRVEFYILEATTHNI